MNSDAKKASPRQRGSQVGFFIDHAGDVQVRHMSGLEFGVGGVMASHPDTESLREQVPCVWYDEDGARHTHWFDFFRHLKSGVRIAIAVKYSEDIASSGVEDVLCRCAHAAFDPQNIGPDGRPFADEFRIVDERVVDGITAYNAGLVQRCLGNRDGSAVAAVRAWLADAPAEFALRSVAPVGGFGRRGLQAAVSLLSSGDVRLLHHERIRPETLFVNQLVGRS